MERRWKTDFRVVGGQIKKCGVATLGVVIGAMTTDFKLEFF